MMPFTRKLVLTSALLTLTGCKLAVIVTSGGDVQSSSGTRNCAGGNVCEFNINSDDFNETFTAIPRPGYEFEKWQAGKDFNCADSTDPVCVISNVGVGAIGEAVLNVLAGDKIDYAMPRFVFVGIDTDGDGIKNHLDDDDDNDGVLDVDDAFPENPDLTGFETVLSGVYLDDLVLTEGGSPYLINGQIELGDGADLIIQPGAKLLSPPDSYGSITIFYCGVCDISQSGQSNVSIIGTEALPVEIQDVSIQGLQPWEETNAPINVVINHALLRGSSLLSLGESLQYPPKPSNYASITLENSVLEDYKVYLNLRSPAQLMIRNNIFRYSGFIDCIGCSQDIIGFGVESAVVENNIFDFSVVANLTVSRYGDSVSEPVVMRGNTFMNVSLSLRGSLFQNNLVVGPISMNGGSLRPIGDDVEMIHNTFYLSSGESVVRACYITNNYWGTLDTGIIDQIIRDRNDSLSETCFTEYLPILDEPHPNTPTLP